MTDALMVDKIRYKVNRQVLLVNKFTIAIGAQPVAGVSEE